MIFESLIGHTPMVEVRPNLYLKLEYANITGSVKDRAALEMILDAENRGFLRPGGTIIEATSGNMGISLAAIAAKRGYSCAIVMPDSMSLERRQMIAAYGAKIVLTAGSQGMAGAVEAAQDLLRQTSGSWCPDQFANPANALAHYRTTGPEIWSQTEGKVDIFVAGVGTGGTITGNARYLKERNPNVRIVAVEPASSPLLSKGNTGSHGIQGIGPNFIPKVLDMQLVDEVFCVTDEQAKKAAHVLAAGEGLLCGISSGAAFHAAEQLAEQNPDKVVVTLLPDSGNRYLSAGIYGSNE